MGRDYIAQINIGKELTEEELEVLFDTKKENTAEFHDSGRTFLSVWSKSLWDKDNERIMEIDINDINAAHKKAVEKYGNKARIFFSLNFN